MEEWRNIPGFEGKYQISISTKEGKCRRVFKHHIKELNQTINKKDGRIRWCLLKDKVKIGQQAARWIALTYPELVRNEWFEGAEIDHIDTDRLNNHPSNLRWVDRKTQQNNPLTKKHISESKKGTIQTEESKEKKRQKLLNRPDHSKWVIKLNTNNEILHFYPSTKQAERETGLLASSIGDCCRGKHKTCGGFVWKYAE
jgi:hypothetical protein